MAVTGIADRTRRGCRAPSGEPVAGGARSGRFGGEATAFTRTPSKILIMPLGEEIVEDPLFLTDPRWRCSRRSFFSGRHGDRQGAPLLPLPLSGICTDRLRLEQGDTEHCSYVLAAKPHTLYSYNDLRLGELCYI